MKSKAEMHVDLTHAQDVLAIYSRESSTPHRLLLQKRAIECAILIRRMISKNQDKENILALALEHHRNRSVTKCLLTAQEAAVLISAARCCDPTPEDDDEFLKSIVSLRDEYQAMLNEQL